MNDLDTLLALLDEEDDDVVIRVALIGDGGVGKSSLVAHLCADLSDRGGLYTPTVGCDVEVLAIQNDENPNETFYVELWDIGGNPHYASARSSLYAECDGFIFVWDADAVHTFHSLERWLSEVLGNKGGLLEDEEKSDHINDEDIDIETGEGTMGMGEDSAKPAEQSRQDTDTRVKGQQVRNVSSSTSSSSSSRRYPRSSSGNKLSSAKYSSGTLDSIITSQRSPPYGAQRESDTWSGSSSIMNSLTNRKQHSHRITVYNTSVPNDYSASSEEGGIWSYLTSTLHDWIKGTAFGIVKQKVEEDDVSPPPLSSQSQIKSSPLSSSMQGNRIRADSLVAQYGIQGPSPGKVATNDHFDDEDDEDDGNSDHGDDDTDGTAYVIRERAAGGRVTDADVVTEPDFEKNRQISGYDSFAKGLVEQRDVGVDASAKNTPPSPHLSMGLSRRRGPQQPQQVLGQQEQQNRKGGKSKRSRGFTFPHGGLPLMIVANKVDKVSKRDLKSLRTTCSNHVFTSAKYESYMDEKPFYDFFHEIKRVYKII